MNVNGKPCRAIWPDEHDEAVIRIIDQRILPHEFSVIGLRTEEETIAAIKDMTVRGAPLIGATGAYGVYLALVNMPKGADAKAWLEAACERISAARPTAVNLAWAVERMKAGVLSVPDPSLWKQAAFIEAGRITDEEVENCRAIGRHGFPLIEEISRKKAGDTVNVLTHCNAGWLACVDYGTATAPIYEAFERGVKIHVWVDETRPLNQGARLTAWELLQHGVPHTVIVDNTGGHLMQHGMVDIVIVGSDRTTKTGDVANKIGTYLKALAAKDNGVPFYVALPSSTIDWKMTDGVGQIPIEERDPGEVAFVQGLYKGETVPVLVPPEKSPCANFAFDVTPGRLVSGLITERGVCRANRAGIGALFPDKAKRT